MQTLYEVKVFVDRYFRCAWFWCSMLCMCMLFAVALKCVLSELYPLLLLQNLYAQLCGLRGGGALHVPTLFGKASAQFPAEGHCTLPFLALVHPLIHQNVFIPCFDPPLPYCLFFTLALTCYLMCLGGVCCAPRIQAFLGCDIQF